jgi:hypothetical protein
LLEGVVAEVAPLCLDDGSGERASLLEPPRRWIGGAPPPREGDRVTLLGYADPTFALAEAPRGPRRSPRRLLVRAARLPLLACCLRQDPGKPEGTTITWIDDRGA